MVGGNHVYGAVATGRKGDEPPMLPVCESCTTHLLCVLLTHPCVRATLSWLYWLITCPLCDAVSISFRGWSLGCESVTLADLKTLLCCWCLTLRHLGGDLKASLFFDVYYRLSMSLTMVIDGVPV